jgi:hypothetical protein
MLPSAAGDASQSRGSSSSSNRSVSSNWAAQELQRLRQRVKALETQLNSDATSKHRAGKRRQQGRLALSPLQALSQEKAIAGADGDTDRAVQHVSRKRPLNADPVHDRTQQYIPLPPLQAISSSSSTAILSTIQTFPQAMHTKQSVSLTALQAADTGNNSSGNDMYANSSAKAQRRGSRHAAASMKNNSVRIEHAALQAGALSSDGTLSTVEVHKHYSIYIMQ